MVVKGCPQSETSVHRTYVTFREKKGDKMLLAPRSGIGKKIKTGKKTQKNQGRDGTQREKNRRENAKGKKEKKRTEARDRIACQKAALWREEVIGSRNWWGQRTDREGKKEGGCLGT